MSSQPSKPNEIIAKEITEFFERMSDVAKNMREAWREGMLGVIKAQAKANRAAGGAAEAMAVMRYRQRIGNERLRAQRFLDAKVREVRAEIRARGLDIPER